MASGTVLRRGRLGDEQRRCRDQSACAEQAGERRHVYLLGSGERRHAGRADGPPQRETFRPPTRGIRPTMGRAMRAWPAVALLFAACGGAAPVAVEQAPAKPRCDGGIEGYRVKGKALQGDSTATARRSGHPPGRPPAPARVPARRGRSPARRRSPRRVKPLPWPGTAPTPDAARRDRRARRRRARRHAFAGQRLPPGRGVRGPRRRAGPAAARARQPVPARRRVPDRHRLHRRAAAEIEVITSQVAEDDSFWDVTRSRYRARGRRFRRREQRAFPRRRSARS